MCLTADEVNPLCDECFAKSKQLPPDGDLEVCQICKEYLDHYCECCMTYRYDEKVEGGCCKQCREQWRLG